MSEIAGRAMPGHGMAQPGTRARPWRPGPLASPLLAFLVLSLLIIAGSALAQGSGATPAQPPGPGSAPPERVAPAEPSPTLPDGGARPLPAPRDGVIPVPPGGDRDMRVTPPAPDPGTTPVIPPRDGSAAPRDPATPAPR